MDYPEHSVKVTSSNTIAVKRCLCNKRSRLLDDTLRSHLHHDKLIDFVGQPQGYYSATAAQPFLSRAGFFENGGPSLKEFFLPTIGDCVGYGLYLSHRSETATRLTRKRSGIKSLLLGCGIFPLFAHGKFHRRCRLTQATGFFNSR